MAHALTLCVRAWVRGWVVCVRVRVCKCWCFAGPSRLITANYNSQLGAWIRKSGAAGTRVHDVSLATALPSEWASHGALLLPKLQSLRPASIDLGRPFPPRAASLQPQCAAPVFAIAPVLAQAEELRIALQDGAPPSQEPMPPPGTLFSVLTSDAEELEQWAAVDAIALQSKMISVQVSCTADEASQLLDSALALTSAARTAGIQVKARLTDPFSDGYLLQDFVQAFADNGVDVVIIQGQGDEDPDDVREHLEALLGLDVAGVSVLLA